MKAKIIELATVVGLASFGGLVNTLMARKDGEMLNWKTTIQEMVIAAFAGIVVYHLISGFEMHPNILSAAIALSGLSARGILALLQKTLFQYFPQVKLWVFISITAILLALSGCQTHRTYYEPNEDVIVEIDGRLYGAVQSETDGIPDWSGGKSLKLSGAGL